MTHEELVAKYPAIFRQKDLPMSQTCMCWGVSCGSGWVPLLDSLCAALTDICKRYDVQVEFTQVKEKYGTLRVYHAEAYGPSWEYKPGRLYGLVCRLQRLRLWRYTKRGYAPEWLSPVRLLLQDLAWAFKGKRFVELERAGWCGGGSMLARRGVQALIEDAVSWHCRFSGMICEECGMSTEEGTGARFGWYTTLCATCKEKGTG